MARDEENCKGKEYARQGARASTRAALNSGARVWRVPVDMLLCLYTLRRCFMTSHISKSCTS